MKRNSVSPEEWIRHRKLRKKIASAKWYSHKKAREIKNQRQHRREIAAKLQQEVRARQGLVWPDVTQRHTWAGVTAHLCRGFPVRPDECHPTLWHTWCCRVEDEITHLREETQAIWPWLPYDWLQQHWIRKILRQLGIREIRQRHATGRTCFDHLHPPLHCPHPHTQDRLWTTSLWNWLWVLTHLGDQREEFAWVWVHVHQHALSVRPPPGTDPTLHVLSSSTVLQHWIRLMSDNLHRLLQDANPTDTDTDSQEEVTETEEETEDEESQNDPRWMKWYTQPPTPEPEEAVYWSDYESTDTDSESVPSSLDTFLFETFRTADTPTP